MKLLTLDEAMAGHPRYYRVTVLAQWIMVPVFGGIMGWLCWLMWRQSANSRVFAAMLLWCVLFLGLFWGLMLNDLRKALKPTAWLAATDDSGVFIKWRSYQNVGWGLDGAQVLYLEWREIRRARRLDKTWITPANSGGRQRAESKQFVELELAPRVVLDELRTILANERDGRPGGVKVKTKWGHFPVSVEGESSIRIEFRARPSLKHFMEEAAAWVEVDEGAQSTTDMTSAEVTDAALLELAGQGEVFPLIAALRRRDGLSLVDAKGKAEAMIRDIQGGATPGSR